jgi:hypothetical protein
MSVTARIADIAIFVRRVGMNNLRTAHPSKTPHNQPKTNHSDQSITKWGKKFLCCTYHPVSGQAQNPEAAERQYNRSDRLPQTGRQCD